jgi:putative DNA primase/helicase
MMLGPCRGGAVRLGEDAESIMVGEGIETCLSAMQVKGIPAWAALSASGLRTLCLPQHVREVIILADGDDAGESAARNAASRWKQEGRCVRIARAPQGMDFNDMLTGRAPSLERVAI